MKGKECRNRKSTRIWASSLTGRRSDSIILGRSQRQPLMTGLVRWLATIAVAIVIPVAVISTVVLGLVHDVGFYHDGQVRYEVGRTTGLTQDVHDRIDRAIVAFFDGSHTLPDALRANQAPPDVFSEKEV